MAASSELPSVSSTSSLPSLASRPSSCSIADLDNQLGETTQQLQAQATPQIAKIIIPSNSNSTTTTTRPTKQMTPFRSFNSLVSKGPFQKAQFHVITALSVLYVASSATVATAQHHRKLEDEANNNDGGEEWNGEWNGEWTANDDASYECNDPNGCDSSSSSSSNSAESNSMWLDNGDMLGPEQIITFVSLGILAFMTLLCCVCYPEILTIGCQKLCSCCMGGGGNNKDKSAVVDEELEGGGDYVRQDTEGSGKKKKKKRTSSRSRSASRSRGKNVELV